MAKTEQDEVIEKSWTLVKEALEEGTITLNGTLPDGKANKRFLDTESIIDLAKFFVQLKIKKPQLITPPEDYSIPKTTGSVPSEDD